MFVIYRPDIWKAAIKKLLQHEGFFNGEINSKWGEIEQQAWCGFCHMRGWSYTPMPNYLLQTPEHMAVLDKWFDKQVEDSGISFQPRVQVSSISIFHKFKPQIPTHLLNQNVNDEIDSVKPDLQLQKNKVIAEILSKAKKLDKIDKGLPFQAAKPRFGMSKLQLKAPISTQPPKIIKTRG